MAKATADPIAAAEAWRSKRKRTHWKPCWACGIPQAATLTVLRKRGWTATEIVDYLVEQCGYTPEDATRNKIGHHFRERHPETRLAS